MNIMLIAPASGRWRTAGRKRLFNGRTFRFSLNSLLSVAAETPPEHEIRILDEQVEDIPADAKPDLVGITCMTALAPRAYEIARDFRARGVPVILGGMHPTFCPDEALTHADAVVAGEVEGVWDRVLADTAAGQLRGLYKADRKPDLALLKPLPRHLLNQDRVATINTVQATRGCPLSCDFCSIAAFSNKSQRQRPVGDVVAEVAALPGRFVLFIDDNIVANKDYALELFAALKPLNKLWISQATMRIAEDDALLRGAAESGCIGVFAGLETFQQDNLRDMHKSFHRVERYRELVRELHARGIAIEAGIFFGFEGDTPDVFAHTVNMLDSVGIDFIQPGICTPLPGTPLYTRMADRIIERDWSHYDFHSVVFEPRGMTAEQLQAGHDWVTRQFYAPWRIARRLARHMTMPRALSSIPYATAINMAYYGRVLNWNIRGRNPALDRQKARRLRVNIPWLPRRRSMAA